MLLLLPVQGEAAAGVAGGSTSVQCCLCPIKRGAFKKTTDTKEWCHMVCGLWHQELVVLPGNICEVVQSKAVVRPEKVGLPCACCQLPYGAVIKCSYGHCQVRGEGWDEGWKQHKRDGGRSFEFQASPLGPGNQGPISVRQLQLTGCSKACHQHDASMMPVQKKERKRIVLFDLE